LEQEKPYLSPQGQTVVDSATELADAAARLLKEKNKNERFQKLYLLTKDKVGDLASFQPSDALADAARQLMNKAAGLSTELRTEAEDIQSYLRSSLYNLVMSPEFRQLAFDFFTIFKDLAASLEDQAEEMAEEMTQAKPKSAKKKNAKQQQPAQGGQKPASYAQAAAQKGGQQKGGQQNQGKGVMKTLSKKAQAVLSEQEEEQVEAIRNRLNDFLKRLRNKKEYQTLISNFFKFSEEIYNTLQNLQENPPPEIKSLQTLINNVFEIIGDFSDAKIVKNYRKDIEKFFEDLTGDEDLSKWFSTAKKYIMDAMKKPDEIDTEEAMEEVRKLIRKGREVLKKYQEVVGRLYDGAVEIFERIKDDPTLQTFSEKLTQLGKNFALNWKGEPDPLVMQESLIQVTGLLVRLFNGYLSNLPIQQLEVYSPNYDVVLQDIKTEGSGFAPESIQVTTASRTIVNLKSRDPSRSVFRIGLQVDSINPCFKDFKYFFFHKSFPSYEDSGRADLCFDGDGLCAKAILTIRSVSGMPSRATLDKLWVTVDNLSLTIGPETKHQILSTLAAPIFAEVLRSKIEATIWSSLRSRFEEIAARLNSWFESNPLSIQPAGVTFQQKDPAQVARDHAIAKGHDASLYLKAPQVPQVDALGQV